MQWPHASSHILFSRAVDTVTQTPKELDVSDPDTSGQRGTEEGGGGALGAGFESFWDPERMPGPRFCVMEAEEGREGVERGCASAHSTYPLSTKICKTSPVGQVLGWAGTELGV